VVERPKPPRCSSLADDLNVGINAVGHALRVLLRSPAALVKGSFETVTLAAMAEVELCLIALLAFVARNYANSGIVMRHVVFLCGGGEG